MAARYGIDLAAELGGAAGTPGEDAADDAGPAGGAKPAGEGTAAGGATADGGTVVAVVHPDPDGADDAADGPGPADGRAGSIHAIRLPRTLPDAAVPWAGLPRRLLVARTGPGTPADLRKVGSGVGRALAGTARAVLVLEDGAAADGLAALAGGLWLDAYRLPTAAREDRTPAPVQHLDVVLEHAPEGADEALALERAATTATHRARRLTATRSTVKNPVWMAAAARSLVAALDPAVRDRVTVDVQDEHELVRRGAGAILAVGGGAATPPRLVTLTYAPARPSGRSVALVGKGITFDTGGLSKKPTSAMLTMTTDMAGSAAVLAAFLAAAALGVPHTVTAVLPLAENAFGADAYRPGDVVTTLSGTTVEIGNTDAEGRMVLADGLTHAIAVADPDVVVDVATLTGAARIGLGTGHSALFATEDALAEELSAAGRDAGEEVWRLPLPADDEAALVSDVADVRQIQRDDAHRVGGTIFAALFLRQFTQGRTWAHLDIAGTGRSTGGKRLPAGAPTGVTAALLTRWLARPLPAT